MVCDLNAAPLRRPDSLEKVRLAKADVGAEKARPFAFVVDAEVGLFDSVVDVLWVTD